MKKLYSLGLALFVGVAAMAADNGPHSHTGNRPVQENSTVRSTVDMRKNENDKSRRQEAYYSSRYGNDSWGRRNNDRYDNWSYANGRYDRYDRSFDRDDRYGRGYNRDDHRDVRNIHDYRQSDHGYSNSKNFQRPY